MLFAERRMIIMKRCCRCNAVYGDESNLCPTCGVRLVTLIDFDSPVKKSDRDVSNSFFQRSTVQEDYNPDLQFKRENGGQYIFNGAVVESETLQFYQSKITKLIRALFGSEPFQLSHTSYETKIRIEEHSLSGYPELAQDFVFYGKLDSIIAPGDDVTIEAKKKGNRYIAKRIYNHTTGRNVSIEANIPSILIKAMVLLLFIAICFLIYRIATIDYATVGHKISNWLISLIPIILVLLFIVQAVRYLFKRK